MLCKKKHCSKLIDKERKIDDKFLIESTKCVKKYNTADAQKKCLSNKDKAGRKLTTQIRNCEFKNCSNIDNTVASKGNTKMKSKTKKH